MRMFANLSANELLASIMRVNDIVELYKKGFEAQNAVLTICAQNELVRRGDIDALRQALVECVDEGWLETGTEFAHMMAVSFSTINDLDPALGKLSKYIFTRTDKNKVVTVDDFETLIRLPKILELNRNRKNMEAEGRKVPVGR